MSRCPNPRCQTDYPDGTLQCTKPYCQCFLPEAVIGGRYRIETLIGIGGMGAVYRASDTFETKQVALKILLLVNPALDVPTAVERFRREARYAHQLQHKNIVPVLNFGQDDKVLYLAMPLVTGGTLKSLMKRDQPLPTPQAQRFLNDLAEAIDAIHHHPQEIVHRDIKPSNLLIHQDDGRLVVTDFGIARALQHEKPLTQSGWSLGTEHYIAPEQEQGKAESVSDIYAMGVVAYQMFTGLLPFQAIIKNSAPALPTPSSLNPALPRAVDDVVLRAIDIDPQKRYRSARAFATALNKALAEETPWSDATVQESSEDTIFVTSNANVIVRTLILENPCAKCGRENRRTSRFCRYCGHDMNDTSPVVVDVCQVGYVSDAGKKVVENEDMLLVVQGLCINLTPPPRPFSLLAIADGLHGIQGKTARGHEASRLAIETVADVVLPLIATTPRSTTLATPARGGMLPQVNHSSQRTPPPTEGILEHWLHDAVRQSNQVIYHCNADYGTTMASTLTVTLLYKHRLYVANVGDSRAYVYNARQGLQRITQEQGSHNLALGQHYQIAIELLQIDVAVDDLILLCSDGLWRMVPDQRIQELLARGGDIQVLAHLLVEAANSAGGEENISAIVARVQ